MPIHLLRFLYELYRKYPEDVRFGCLLLLGGAAVGAAVFGGFLWLVEVFDWNWWTGE